MSQSARITVDVKIDQAIEGDLNVAKNSVAFSDIVQLLNGTDSGQASKTFSDRRTIAGGATDSLDLTAVLLDAFGNAISFTAIKAIVIRAAAGNGDTLTVGGNENAFASFLGSTADAVVIDAGGLFVMTSSAGYTVVANTGDVLDITNDDVAAAEYEIILIGI
jgi:hypothetical protein